MYSRRPSSRQPSTRQPMWPDPDARASVRSSARHYAPPSPPPARRQRPHARLIAIWSVVGIGLAAISGLATVLVTQTLSHASPAPSGLTVSFGDSTALVGWQPVSGATAYRVTLIRTRDMGIMEQFVVPASQHLADAQGIWTGERYEVAVQAADSSGSWGAASVSAQGQAQPISRSTLNGFLDTENRPAGTVDANLWDVTFDHADGNGGAFVNAQLHYHVTANSISKSPSVTDMRARVPMDWSGRTITVHGEVDLKGTTNNWFGIQVMPDSAATDRMQDLAEHAFVGYHIPTISLFDDNLGLHLLYAPGDGSMQKDLGVYPNPINLSNVRDTVDWSFSVSHVTVMVDGKTAFDRNWPTPLTFTHGYLNLMAQAYMARPHLTSCDMPMQDCNIWHLDNWGFDAPAGQVQPLSAAYYATGCHPYPDRETAGFVNFNTCGNMSFANGAMPGMPQSVTIPVSTVSHLTAATLVASVQGMKTTGELLASVNGGAWLPTQFVPTDHKAGDSQDYLIPFSPTLLMAGANTVRFEKSGCSACWVQVYDPQIETLSSDPYVAPAEPAQPAPLGTWNGGQGGLAASSAVSAPSGTNTDPAGGTTSTGSADGKGTACPGNSTGGDSGGTSTGGDTGGSTGSGDTGGTSAGSGDSGGTSTGSGDMGGSTGTGDTGGTSTSSGDHGTSTGTGDSGSTSTGGDTGGSSAGTGDTGGSSLGLGDAGASGTSTGDSGTTAGSGDTGGTSAGTGDGGGTSTGGDTGGTSMGSGDTGGTSTGDHGTSAGGDSGGSSTGTGDMGGTSAGSGDTGGSTGSGDTGPTCTGGSSTGSGDMGGSTGSGESGGTSTGGDSGGTSTGSGDTGGTSTGSGDSGGTSTGSGESGGSGSTGGSSSMTISGMPCTATINGQKVTGFCSGTFNPGATGTSGA